MSEATSRYITVTEMATPATPAVSYQSSNPDPETVGWSEEERLAAAQRLYTPIKKWQTRILRLHGGSGDTPLAADLLIADIVDLEGLVLHDEQVDVAYEAVSYCWGAAVFSCPIVCNGIAYAITPSLSGALKRFRRTDESRYLWAHALCIHQADDEEKSLQVLNMFKIFRKARRVLIWLGEHGENTERVMECLGNGFIPEHAPRIYSELPQAEFELVRSGLEDLYHRPWSKRIWVQQELFAARSHKVYCGSYKFDDIEDYEQAIRCLFSVASSCD